MGAKRSVLILLVGAIFGAIGCQEAAQQTRFRVRVPEGSGLHHTQTVRIGVSAQTGSEVQLALEPENCGGLAGSQVTRMSTTPPPWCSQPVRWRPTAR